MVQDDLITEPVNGGVFTDWFTLSLYIIHSDMSSVNNADGLKMYSMELASFQSLLQWK